MKKIVYYSLKILRSIILMSLSLILGCTQAEKKSNDEHSLKQNKSDLIDGQVLAVAYSGFRSGQHPDRGDGAKNPGDDQILEDLNIISRNSNFNLIRLYDSQQNSKDVLRIIHNYKLDIKVLLGIWLDAEISNHERCWWLNEPIPQAKLDANKLKNKKEIETAIKLANEYKDIIVAINVGNEALVSWNDHMVTVDSVISYVKHVKKSVKQLVTVADNFKWWAESGAELAKEVDFLGIHVYPLWEGQDIDTAIAYTAANVKEVADSLPNAKIVITEAGWATIASEFGARGSEAKQKKYFNDMKKWSEEMNITTFFFEAFDEDWKGNPDNPMGAEKHWGLFTVDRKAKLVMYDLYPDLRPE